MTAGQSEESFVGGQISHKMKYYSFVYHSFVTAMSENNLLIKNLASKEMTFFILFTTSGDIEKYLQEIIFSTALFDF